MPKNFEECNTEKDIDINDLPNRIWIIRENGSGTRHVTDSMFNDQVQITLLCI